MGAKKVRVAIVGVGNCASSLVQGLEYYKDAADDARVPGLMHVRFGDYHVSDVEVVAAFDVDAKKVGLDLSEAIFASENRMRVSLPRKRRKYAFCTPDMPSILAFIAMTRELPGLSQPNFAAT